MSSLLNVPELQPFVVSDVRVTGRVLGEGSYGSVEEAKIPGATCVVKKLHEALLPAPTEAHGADRMAATFVAECRLMSTVRHPHIVQFLGVCFLPRSRLPALIMEKLLVDLHNLLENNANVPLSMKHSILLGVSKGLTYLHARRPAIIHRDLSARNVLLNSAMVAKIADLGNSRIINVRPSQLMTMTKNPGNMWYMPPEAQEDASKYNTSIDVFSFGNLTLFTLTQEFPNVKPATSTDPNTGRINARSEVERRSESFEQIYLDSELGRDHSLVRLAEQCLHNVPSRRPPISEVLARLEEVSVSVCDQYSTLNKLEMLKLHERVVVPLQSEQARLQSEQARLQSEQARLQRQLQEKDQQIQLIEGELRRIDEAHQLEQQSHQEEQERQQQQVASLEAQLRDLQLQSVAAPVKRPAGSLPFAATANIIIPRAVIGRERTITIQARNAKGEPHPHGGEDIQATLTLRGSAGPPINIKVRDNRDGTYRIAFTTQHCGYHQLDITICKKPIQGSPFSIYSRQARSYTSLSTPLQTIKCSSYPWGIAVSEDGDLYVCLVSGRIAVFNASGSRVRSIGSEGSGDGQFNAPVDLALQGDVLYVVAFQNKYVQKFTILGKFISKFGENEVLSSPECLCLDHEGRVFVADTGNSRVSVFKCDGTYLYSIRDPEKLSRPLGLAFDPSGNLHVVDTKTNCVRIFSPRGDYITEYGKGEFSESKVHYIALNEEGYSFVSCGSLLIFDPQHKCIYSSEYMSYRGVALDKDGHIYIANRSQTILKF